MTQYRKGRDAEYRYRDALLARGYHTVLRMAGSHGPADLVAVGDNHVLFVQVKTTAKRRPDYSTEIEAFRAWPVPPHDRREFAIEIRHGGARKWVIVPL